MTETPTDGGGPIVPGPGGRIEDPVGGFEAMGDRFLEQDMLAAARISYDAVKALVEM